ncbi:MAG: DUF2796 domain-containing protein [Sulfuritalea sp.]|nr:DUF2796 domain-containing protein [Sulfuritalea sp.]
MRTCLLLASLATFAAPICPAHAGKAHVHGDGKLEVVIDKGDIAINLELPMDVAVGFERAPKSEKEKAALSTAEKLLGDTAAMFVPTAAAGCSALPAKVTMPSFGATQGGDAHADIDASYAFRCTSPAALTSIETGIFMSFKRLYRLEAQRVGPSGQGKQRLTPKSPALNW